VPPDADGDFTSDRNDPDDDNDGAPDTSDPFALDPANGTATNLGVRRSFNSDGSNPGGLLNLGFTGLMTNGVSDYLSLFDPAQMTAGGAAGVVTVDAVPAGDPLGSSNSQQYGFQFGAAVPGERFVAHTRVMAPFAGLTPQGSQSMGLFIGTGDQDNYAKLVVSAQGGGGVQFLREVAGSAVTRPLAPVPLPGPEAIDLWLAVEPATATVQPSYAVTTGGTRGPRTNLGGPEAIPPAWAARGAVIAAGVISTSSGGPPFPASWDFLNLEAEPAAAVAPANTSAPTISGAARVGSVLSASAGTWTGTPPLGFTYQWRRCTSTTLASCTGIAGATSSSYTAAAGDWGYRLRVVVTAANAGGTAAATSSATASVRLF
ncbi:MAG: hypothetical protein ACRD0D_12700, partial [Acidimicrobiales bacterium]